MPQLASKLPPGSANKKQNTFRLLRFFIVLLFTLSVAALVYTKWLPSATPNTQPTQEQSYVFTEPVSKAKQKIIYSLIHTINHLVNNKQYEQALPVIDSLEQRTGPSDAWFLDLMALKSLCCYNLEQWDCAQTALEVLHFRQNSPQVEQMLTRIQTLQQESDAFIELRSEHFRIFLEPGTQDEFSDTFIEALESSYNAISYMLQYQPPQKIGAVLFSSPRHSGHWDKPEWTGAIYDGRIRIPYQALQQWPATQQLIRHELAHAFIQSLTQTHIPHWLNEGLAQYLDGSTLQTHLLGDSIPSFEALQTAFIHEKNAVKVQRMYQFSLAMVLELIEKVSFSKIPAFLQSISQSDLETSLQNFAETTPQQLYFITKQKSQAKTNKGS